MSSKFDQIYNQFLEENTIPATTSSTANVNVSKEVQDFFNKHQTSPGFFDALVAQLEAAKKAQTQQPQQNNNQQQQQPQANQQQNNQQAQANQQKQQPQANQQQNQQQAGQQQNQQQKKI
jgi:hypothetical protein